MDKSALMSKPTHVRSLSYKRYNLTNLLSGREKYQLENKFTTNSTLSKPKDQESGNRKAGE
ncbi:hypothetical protein PanWU01x14_109840 [Parasponia andersonii]|uniref:Uncharacterized protein n=1 Tax=Parasponia andersonii TaxID=3476 RepID=A0A2P5CZT1_PARAD|nr:hypothetical protein PanWU01x14_109840 [Parasponia andersonii]